MVYLPLNFHCHQVSKPPKALSFPDTPLTVLDCKLVGLQVNWTGLGEVEGLKKYIVPSNGKIQNSQNSWLYAYNLLLGRAIDYWYKHQWISSSSERITEISGRAGNENDDDDLEVDATEGPGINVSMRYIQDKNGQVIDGHRAREIRIHARAVFVGFAMQGKLFASWGDADALSRRTFYNEMANRFDELQYCDLDWKAEQIATDTFPGWKFTWLKKKKKEDDQKNGLKRAHQGPIVEESEAKRSKAMEGMAISLVPPKDVSMSSQQPTPTINIIPNTPARPIPAAQGPENPYIHQRRLPKYDFPINNPLSSNNDTSAFPTPLTDKFLPVLTAIQPSSHQALEVNGMQPVMGNFAASHELSVPTKRSRMGITKMRPSKTSFTSRNLCALKWATLNPKGTTDEFSTYYDALSKDEKEKWGNYSVEAKKSGKTASEWVQELQL
ncbi:hypothetical protein BDN70DRAFT_101295 [Pholiota conissans]|uniref:Uncharacterized protein n=1 Tax=Pholiota conissans TaxID=109636 RepID=A0A9P5YYS9_9AGAR|nr:hypothetical protein BDN70DRAFT_101295 [Pholiota conissans]